MAWGRSELSFFLSKVLPIVLIRMVNLNPFRANLSLYLLKTRGFLTFQGVQNWNIGVKLVNFLITEKWKHWNSQEPKSVRKFFTQISKFSRIFESRSFSMTLTKQLCSGMINTCINYYSQCVINCFFPPLWSLFILRDFVLSIHDKKLLNYSFTYRIGKC